MCYNVTNSVGLNSTWTNRILYDSFSDQSWTRSFYIDTWNNSLFCCSDPLVSPTYNKYENVISDKELTLRVEPVDNVERIVAYSSSISSYRDDIQYGSFRMSAKMPELNGTSFGFFFFYSVSEEIDVEVLAHEQESGKVRVSIQPIVRDNLGRASNISQKVLNLNKSLSADFVEYRFDWFKNRVDFFTDSEYRTSLHVNIPSHHGKIVVNHRTNGNPKWSRGPPTGISDVKIKYIDLYFNSSESQECKNINDVEYQFYTEEWKKYTSSIVVACLFAFIILSAFLVNLYRKFIPIRPSTVLVEAMTITNRRP
jgi:beta-glucanase (GH16 family)